jgi:SAM-dependent methyltransferase
VTYDGSAALYRRHAPARYAGNDVWLLPILATLDSRPGARALDVGSAVGTNSFYLAKHGYAVTGIESSSEMVSAARAASGSGGLDNRPRFIRQDFCTWVPDKPLFELVLATAFVHLFTPPLDRDITDALLYHVAPGGAAIISTTLEAQHSQALRSKLDSQNPAPGQPLSDLRWRNHYTRATFRNLVERVAIGRFGATCTVEEHRSQDPERPEKVWSDIVVKRPS